jgi:hypothetical protein
MFGARHVLVLGVMLVVAGFWFRGLSKAARPGQVADTRHRLLKQKLQDPNSRKLENFDERMHAMHHRLPIYARWLMIVGAVIAAAGIVLEVTGLLPAM